MLSWPEASYELIKKIISLSLHKSSQTNIMSVRCVKFWMVAVFQYDFVSLSITYINKECTFMFACLTKLPDSGRTNGSSAALGDLPHNTKGSNQMK